MGRGSQYYITVTLVVEKEGDQYASYCQELGTASCGDSYEEALKNIKEAVIVDLNALEEIGERARFFRERRIRKRRVSQTPKQRRPVNRPVSREAFTTIYDAQIPLRV